MLVVNHSASDMAREVRASPDNNNLAALESIHLELSQAHSLDIQINTFVKALQGPFIKACQENIELNAKGQADKEAL